jgi:hypothetical protein
VVKDVLYAHALEASGLACHRVSSGCSLSVSNVEGNTPITISSSTTYRLGVIPANLFHPFWHDSGRIHAANSDQQLGTGLQCWRSHLQSTQMGNQILARFRQHSASCLAGCSHADAGIPLNREQCPVAPLGALHSDLSHLFGFRLRLMCECWCIQKMQYTHGSHSVSLLASNPLNPGRMMASLDCCASDGRRRVPIWRVPLWQGSNHTLCVWPPHLV